MAKVTVKVTGGDIKEMNADTVGDIKDELNLSDYTATVNGEPAEDDYELEDFNFVTLSTAVKGGC